MITSSSPFLFNSGFLPSASMVIFVHHYHGLLFVLLLTYIVPIVVGTNILSNAKLQTLSI